MSRNKHNAPHAKIAASAPAPSTSGMERLMTKHRWIFIGSFLIITAFVFRDFIFFNKLFLFKDIGSDTLNIYYPQYTHLAEYIAQNGLPLWSFNEGMGQSIFALSLGYPFNFLFALGGKENIPSLLVYIEIIKIFFTGFFIYRFLLLIRISELAAIVGGLLFAFSGFMIVGGSWYVFSYEGMCCALCLLGLELWLRNKNPFVYILSISLIGAFQPVNLSFAALLTFLYFIFRTLFTAELQIRLIVKNSLMIIGFFVLGTGIASVLLFPGIYQILNSPRGSGNSSYFNTLYDLPALDFAEPMQYISLLLRMFSSDLMGSGNNFSGWNNYLESPLMYCGIGTLVLIPHAFFFMDAIQRKWFAILLVLISIPFLFPWFRYAFWFFSGDYYRSLVLFYDAAAILAACFSLHQFTKHKIPDYRLIAATAILLLLILFFPNPEKDKMIDSDLRLYVSVFIIAYSLLLAGLRVTKQHSAIFISMVLLFIAELSFLSYHSHASRPELTQSELRQKNGYNDYTNEALTFLRQNDSTFYRILKDYSSGPTKHGSLNDGKAQNYFGTSEYHSFPQQNYVRFFQKTGITQEGNELQARWVPGLLSRTLLQPITQCKYLLSKKTDSYPRGMGYDSIAAFGDVKVWKNRFYLPLGFCYDHTISESVLHSVSSMKKDMVLLKACAIDDSEIPGTLLTYSLADTATALSFPYFKSLVDSLLQDTLSGIQFSHTRIKGNISVPRTKILFFSIPFDTGWTATIDNQPANILRCNYGFSGILVSPGNHSVELKYEEPYLKQGLSLSVISILLLGATVVLRKKLWN